MLVKKMQKKHSVTLPFKENCTRTVLDHVKFEILLPWQKPALPTAALFQSEGSPVVAVVKQFQPFKNNANVSTRISIGFGSVKQIILQK